MSNISTHQEDSVSPEPPPISFGMRRNALLKMGAVDGESAEDVRHKIIQVLDATLPASDTADEMLNRLENYAYVLEEMGASQEALFALTKITTGLSRVQRELGSSEEDRLLSQAIDSVSGFVKRARRRLQTTGVASAYTRSSLHGSENPEVNEATEPISQSAVRLAFSRKNFPQMFTLLEQHALSDLDLSRAAVADLEALAQREPSSLASHLMVISNAVGSRLESRPSENDVPSPLNYLPKDLYHAICEKSADLAAHLSAYGEIFEYLQRDALALENRRALQRAARKINIRWQDLDASQPVRQAVGKIVLQRIATPQKFSKAWSWRALEPILVSLPQETHQQLLNAIKSGAEVPQLEELDGDTQAAIASIFEHGRAFPAAAAALDEDAHRIIGEGDVDALQMLAEQTTNPPLEQSLRFLVSADDAMINPYRSYCDTAVLHDGALMVMYQAVEASSEDRLHLLMPLFLQLEHYDVDIQALTTALELEAHERDIILEAHAAFVALEP